MGSDPTYEAWKLKAFSTARTKQIKVPILPMRHGNMVGYVTKYLTKQSSDPTYEAWKRGRSENLKPSIHSSDPTYEAWKHPSRYSLFPFVIIVFRSYL